MTELAEKYRAVFNTPMGQEVLADILVNKLHFGCYLEKNVGDIALNNTAIAILSTLGIVSKGNGLEVIRSLMTVTPKTPAKPDNT